MTTRWARHQGRSLASPAGQPAAPRRRVPWRHAQLGRAGQSRPRRVRADELPWLAGASRRARVLVNVVGFTIEEYGEIVSGPRGCRRNHRVRAQPLVSQHQRRGHRVRRRPACVRRIVSVCRRRTRLPLAAKFSPVLPDIATMALVARDAGADGVTVVNTLPGLLFEDGRQGPAGAREWGSERARRCSRSGSSPRPRVVERTGGMPVIGVGGVRSAADVQQYLERGRRSWDRNRRPGASPAAEPHHPGSGGGTMAELDRWRWTFPGRGRTGVAGPAPRRALGEGRARCS